VGAPRLTVALPVYNGERFLAEAINAILGQTYEDFVLVISDNASTDRTPEICREFAKLDSRIQYIRQERNIGLIGNHNFLIAQAEGELFKLAAYDDLYARTLLERCIDALDNHQEVVVAHCWEARVDEEGKLISGLAYSVAADAPRPPERFRSMLFDGWDDYMYGVIRTTVLRQTHLYASHHFADRTINTELSLYGPFHLVPEWLYFRREHAGRASEHPDRSSPYTVRSRSAGLDPRRSNRLRHPSIRLYLEYVRAYVTMIRTAPLSAVERRECYIHLSHWVARRFPSVVNRAFHSGRLHDDIQMLPELPDVDVAAVVSRAARSDF
jgi:glycosyltransferase involved in cell wall biosynthesis